MARTASGDPAALFGWGPTFDDWLDVLTTRSLGRNRDGARRPQDRELRHALASFPNWTEDGREWHMESRSTPAAGADYMVQSRPIEDRYDSLGRYRSWPSGATKDVTTDFRTPASELTRCSG